MTILAIAIGFYATGKRDRSSVASGSPALVGTAWRLTEVGAGSAVLPHRDEQLPAGFTGSLIFHPDGTFDGQNADNGITGTYRASGNTITMQLEASGAAGTAGRNNGVEAMNSLYVPSGQRPTVTSNFRITTGTLVMTNAAWRLTFRPSTSVVGVHWQLRSVRGPQGTHAVAASLGASVEFGADGSFGMSDTVNHMGGHYRPVQSGYAVAGPVTTTLAAYGGKDPTRLAVIAGIRACTGRGPIRAVASDRHLVISAGDYTLTFSAGGAVRPIIGTSATPTAVTPSR